ncbi:MAG TPA: zinc ribbon domain-containing protein [Acidimicrobiales bacterium]|nr:zinc ribbon domain-containing protein [Acidimicrobiales bacterium]
MPIYEYRCKECDEAFELRRPAAESSDPATCSQGHQARRVLSVFAAVGAPSGEASPAPTGGCGPGCACAAGL